eukprot:gene43036-53408_t
MVTALELARHGVPSVVLSAELQLAALIKSHPPRMPVQYPTRAEWEAAKKLMRGGVQPRPEQEIDRGRPVNPLDDLKLATRAQDHIPAVAPLANKPTLPSIAPSYFRSHTSVALLHETDADGLAAVAGTRISVIPTEAPYGSFNRHSGPEIEFVTGFWDVGAANLGFAPALTLYAISHQGLVGARTLSQRYWDISNADHYCGGYYPGKGFDDPRNDETTPVRGYAKMSDTSEVLVRLVVPGKLPPDAVKVKTQRYPTSWMMPAEPPFRPQPLRKNTAVLVHEIDLDRDGVADILRIDTPSPADEAVPTRGPSFRLLAIAALLLLLVGVVGGGWAVNRWLTGDGTAPTTKTIDTSVAGGSADPVLIAGAAPKGAAAGQPLIVAPVDGANALAARVAELEQRLSRITLQAESASGNASRSEGLLVAFAVRRALDRGLSLGYLDAQLRLRFGDDQPNAVKTIIETSRDPVTLEQLRAELDTLAPQLVGRGGDGSGSLWTGLRRELGELFVVRAAGTQSPRA